MQRYKRKFSKGDFYANIIVLALVFAPFTNLRIGFVGLTEMLMLIMVFFILKNRKYHFNLMSRKSYFFTRFWIIFITMSLLGALWNYIVLDHVSGTLNSLVIDLSSYLVVLVVCFSIETLIYNEVLTDLWIILKRTFISASTVLLVLYLIATLAGNIFGLPLKYYNFFRPFSNNIHHVAMSIAPLPFIGLKLITFEKTLIKKFLLLLLVISNVITANATGSLKVTLGLIAGIIVFLTTILFTKIRNNYMKWIVFLCFVIILGVLVTMNFDSIIRSAGVFFVQEDIGGGRQKLWSNSVEKILVSPIFGYGPGPHASYWAGSFSDAHQTILTVGLQAGLTGILAFIYLNYRILKTLARDPYLISAFVGILLYALGGDIMRRLPIWIFFILFYYYSKSRVDKLKKEGDSNE